MDPIREADIDYAGREFCLSMTAVRAFRTFAAIALKFGFGASRLLTTEGRGNLLRR